MTKDLNNISPVVNSVGKTSFSCGYKERNRNKPISDHDLHFVASGRGALIINDTEYQLGKGDMFLVYPGEGFNVYTEGSSDFVRYYIHFDFYNTNKLKRKTPILPNGKKWPRIVHIQTDAEIRTICSAIVYHHIHNQSMVSPIITSGELKALLGLVLNTYLNTKDSHQFRRIKSYKSIIKAEKFIRANYQRDITLQDMAREANLSKTYFGNIFKKIIGKSPIDYLTSIRINHAKRLLIETDYNISEISSLVGYEDSHYFSYIFKQKEGISPSEFLISLSETV